MEKHEANDLPKLVGTNFVKRFREYLLSLITEDKLIEKDIVKKAFLEKNVKPDTTRKYLQEMIDMDIIKVNGSDLFIIIE